jgi:peptide/nickel transport system substrate-binding protein
MSARGTRLATTAVALGLVLAACGGTGDDTGDGAPPGGVEFDAGSTGVVDPSDRKGGVLKFALRGDFDSTDPGAMYYAFSNNFARLYARGLLTYTSKPGVAGTKPAPDLAEALGEPGDGNKTWTYRLRKGIKYEDGTEVTARDVKYAVARTFDRDVLQSGPAYFKTLLDADGYQGPYKDTDLDHFTGVATPDDHTVVFRLKEPFGEFNELLMFSGQTAPVPQAKDSGADYRLHPLSTGPYMWDGDYEPDKGGALVHNPHWDAATDPNRAQLPDRVEVTAGVDADKIDDIVLDGDAHVAMTGNGLDTAARDKVLADPELKARADNPVTGFHSFIPVNTKLVPNVDCRRAIVYAADRDAMWQAYGGAVGGEMATSIQPPNIPGRQAFDMYEAEPGYHGDKDKARDALAKCGKPDGFSTVMTYHGSDADKAAAEAMRTSLGEVGIKVTLTTFETGTYALDQVGSPAFMAQNQIGLATYGWAADWPTGYGFMQPLLDGEAIQPTGNVNVPELDDPAINTLWHQAAQARSPEEREKLYAQIDHKALELAAVVPNIYVKSFLYRPPTLTNVYFHQGYNMYDYANLGVSE